MSSQFQPDAPAAYDGAKSQPPAADSAAQLPAGRAGSKLAGWGRTFVPGYEVQGEQLERLTSGCTISRGLGRSYGDSSLPPSGKLKTLGTTLADRILAFDEESGILRVEAGLSLYDMNRIFLPKKWFTPVTPGTQYVTLGGMVASDVHGKNHHINGTFGSHVLSLKLALADGRIIGCSREHQPDLFVATLGGMGLTGHILEVEVQMERIASQWIYGVSHRLPSIDALLEAVADAADEWPFLVTWMDSRSAAGRGHLYCGRWARPDEAPTQAPKAKGRITMPFSLPSGTVNAFTIRLFNAAVYWSQPSKPKAKIIHPETYFYPLDIVKRWNLAYGARGVTQYQCLIPKAAGRAPIKELLEVLLEHKAASFLTVVKDCGQEGEGLLSFPAPGITVAVDLPIGTDTQATVNALNEVVIRAQGRIYLSKDGFTTPAHFRMMEPRLGKFLQVRRKWDPEQKIRSAQSVRLMGDRA